MVIGFDIDNTMTDSSGVVNKIFLDSEYSIYANDFRNLPINLYEEFINKYTFEIRKNDTLMDNVVETFNYLKSKNHKIIIITRRGYNENPLVKEITLNNLKRWKLPYDNIYFESTDKGEDATKDGVNIFVDDHVFNLDSVAKKGIDCLKFGSHENNDKYDEVHNWKELLEYLKKKGY